MSDVAAPGWARLTGRDLGSVGRASRGAKKSERRKILSRSPLAAGFATRGKTFRKCPHGLCAMSRQFEGTRLIGSLCDPRLALAVLLRPRSGDGHPRHRPARARVVKHLPLFFDLEGRRVVVVGNGPAADRRADLARSA